MPSLSAERTAHVDAAPTEHATAAAARANTQVATISSRLAGSFSFKRAALTSPLAGSSTPTPALDALTNGAVQLQLTTAAAPVGGNLEQPSLAGLPGSVGQSHLEDGFSSPGTACFLTMEFHINAIDLMSLPSPLMSLVLQPCLVRAREPRRSP